MKMRFYCVEFFMIGVEDFRVGFKWKRSKLEGNKKWKKGRGRNSGF